MVTARFIAPAWHATDDVARDPLPFLVRAGEVLAASLDYEQTVRALVDLVVPALADMCSIHLLDDDGRFRRIGARHHTEEAAALSAALTDHYLDFGQRDGPIHRLLGRAETLLSSPVRDQDLDLIVGPVRRRHLVSRLGLTSAMVVPLIAHDRPFGVLCLSTAVRPIFDHAHVHLAQEIGRRGALALDNVRLYREAASNEQALQHLVQRLMAAQEDERRRLAYEIHDGAAQTAAGTVQYLEAFAHAFPGESEAARHRLDVAVGLARQTVSEIRRVLGGLRPTTLDDFGLTRALQVYADGLSDDAFRVTFVAASEPGRISPDLEIALFRTAQEAVTNARKHARVDAVLVQLTCEQDQIILTVEDHGCGIDRMRAREGSRPGQRLGLLSMRERIAQVGGSLVVRSRPGEGTLVRAVVPIAGSA